MTDASFSTIPYHTYIPTMGDWGWVLGMKAEEMSEEDLARRTQQLTFENIETQFLNAEAMRECSTSGRACSMKNTQSKSAQKWSRQ